MHESMLKKVCEYMHSAIVQPSFCCLKNDKWISIQHQVLWGSSPPWGQQNSNWKQLASLQQWESISMWDIASIAVERERVFLNICRLQVTSYLILAIKLHFFCLLLCYCLGWEGVAGIVLSRLATDFLPAVKIYKAIAVVPCNLKWMPY